VISAPMWGLMPSFFFGGHVEAGGSADVVGWSIERDLPGISRRCALHWDLGSSGREASSEEASGGAGWSSRYISEVQRASTRVSTRTARVACATC